MLYYKWENRYFSCKKTDGSCRFENLFDKIMKEIKIWLELPEETLYIIKTDRYSELINPTFNDVVNMRIIDNREQVGNEGIFKSEANVELDDVEQKIVLARKYLGFLNWEYDEGKRFVSKEHYESVVRDFAQLLASGVCPNNVKTIEMLNKKSYNFVTACLYDAYLVEKRDVESNRIDDEWVKFCQKLFPNRRFKRGDFSQRPGKYDEWVGKYKSTIGK